MTLVININIQVSQEEVTNTNIETAKMTILRNLNTTQRWTNHKQGEKRHQTLIYNENLNQIIYTI